MQECKAQSLFGTCFLKLIFLHFNFTIFHQLHYVPVNIIDAINFQCKIQVKLDSCKRNFKISYNTMAAPNR